MGNALHLQVKVNGGVKLAVNPNPVASTLKTAATLQVFGQPPIPGVALRGIVRREFHTTAAVVVQQPPYTPPICSGDPPVPEFGAE